MTEPMGRPAGTNETLDMAIAAHGGRQRWREVSRISATLSAGGVLWASRGQTGAVDDITVTIETGSQRASIDRLVAPDRRAVFTPERVAFETAAGELLAERRNPRASFHAGSEAPWDSLHLAYFVGCAMWTYLAVPFLLDQPDVAVEELEPGEEDGQLRRRLRATFPSGIATHGREQVFHFGPGGLLRRQDYTPELLAGNRGHLAVAHYTDRHRRFDGISVPTRRRAVGLKSDGNAVPGPVLVTIEVREVSIA